MSQAPPPAGLDAAPARRPGPEARAQRPAPLRLRVVDYVANPGGGMRYIAQALGAMSAVAGGLSIEVVSHSQALERYRAGLAEVGVAAAYTDAPPRNRAARALYGAGRVKALRRWLGARGVHAPIQFEVPGWVARGGADAVWFPWIHLHMPPPPGPAPVVATLHDLIFFTSPETLPPGQHARERRAVEGWLGSGHRVVMTSRATLGTARELFGIAPDRAQIIRVAEQHRTAAPTDPPAAWAWVRGPFALLPANLSPHKDHETAIRAWGAWARAAGTLDGGSALSAVPVVLCGRDADLSARGRGAQLARLCQAQGLRLGVDVISLGFVQDPVYFGLLQRAWALVMPSRHEGGGSFPVAEAVRAGVPVVCSDIPVLREHMEAIGGRVSWFGVGDADDLTTRLAALRADHARVSAEARARVSALSDRGWDQVAREYLDVIARASRLAEHARARP